MLDSDDRSFLVSFVVHAACLLTLAHTVPETHSAGGKPIALTFEQSADDGAEPLVEPLVEWQGDVTDPADHQQSRAAEAGEAAFAEAMENAPLSESNPLIAQPDSFSEIKLAEKIPGVLVLLADASRSLAKQRPMRGSPFGNEGDGDGATSFFGIRDGGDSVAYVVDCSSSMAGPPLDRLKEELLSSIAKLSPKKTFTVIFFNDEAIPMRARPRFLPANEANKTMAMKWIYKIPASGGTEPSTALSMALQMKPSVVFLMTDGQFTFPFPKDTMAMLENKPSSRARINTIALGQQAATEHLQTIAGLTGGHFASVAE